MKTQSMDERGRSTLGMVNEIGYCYPREATKDIPNTKSINI